MKYRHEIKVWLCWFIMLFVLYNMVSCTALKKVTSKNATTTKTEKVNKAFDSSLVKEVNKKIDDVIVTPVQSSGDPAYDKRIDEILSKLNIKKNSGSNNYNLYYDKLKREIIAELEVGETADQTTNTNSTETKEKTVEERIDEYIKKTKIPFLFWAVLIIWFLPQILKRLQLISNPIYSFLKNIKKPD